MKRKGFSSYQQQQITHLKRIMFET